MMDIIAGSRETAEARLLVLAERYERAAEQLRALAKIAHVQIPPGSLADEGLWLLTLRMSVP